MHNTRLLGAALLASALFPLAVPVVHAEEAATTVWRTDVSAGFARYERAWAALQLGVTSGQYDIGDEVTAAAMPTSQATLFTAYRLTPSALPDRTMQTLVEPGNADGSRVRVCLSATLRTAAALDGFLQGMRQAGASLATSTCQPGAISSSFAYPVQLHAYKVVRAMRAVSFIERDQAERAAQAAVADTIGFTLPEGKLLNMAAQPGAHSGDYGVYLHNNSALPWALASANVGAPFTATVSGCENVLPGTSCLLTVSFSPTSTGRFMDFVTVTPVAGKTLSIRVGGTGMPTP
jgi:hypothetical protein